MKEKRIYYMTKLAIFEEHHREQLQGVRTCFRSDYIGRSMVKNGVRVTAAYLLLLMGWGLYHAEMLVVDISRVDFPVLAARVMFLYAVMLAVFLVMTYSIESVRYARARKDLEEYRSMLKILEQCYEEEEKGR